MKSRWEVGVDAHESRYFGWWVGSGASGGDGSGGNRSDIFF